MSRLPEIANLQRKPYPSDLSDAELPRTSQPRSGCTWGGSPVYVLYVTQSEDTVLVRCCLGDELAIAELTRGKNQTFLRVDDDMPFTSKKLSPKR